MNAKSEVPAPVRSGALDGVIQAALDIAHELADSRRQLKAALIQQDLQKSIKMACEVAGLSETSFREDGPIKDLLAQAPHQTTSRRKGDR